MTFIFYCMSSTCMLLKMMEKSRNIVFVHQKKIRAESFTEKKILHKQWARKKNSCKVKISPTPSLFSKSILFTSGAGVGQHFS